MVEMSFTEGRPASIARTRPRCCTANCTQLETRHTATFLSVFLIATLADHCAAQRTSSSSRSTTKIAPLPTTSVLTVLKIRRAPSAQLTTLVRAAGPTNRDPSRGKPQRGSSLGRAALQFHPDRFHQRCSCLQRSLTCRQNKASAAFRSHETHSRRRRPLRCTSSFPSISLLPPRAPSGSIPTRPDNRVPHGGS